MSMCMIVRRSDFIHDTLRKCARSNFNPAKTIDVEFVGEQGLDTGGLTREFFSLLERSVSPMFISDTGTFSHDSVALKKNLFFIIGQLASMSLVQGGSGFNVLSPSVFKYLCGVNLRSIDVQPEEVPDPNICAIIEEVSSCSNVEELHKVCCKHDSELFKSGFTKPVCFLQMHEKELIIQSLATQCVLLESKAEMDQFSEGISCLGSLEMMKTYPDILDEFFVQCKRNLTADCFRKLFHTFKFADEGTNERSREEATYMLFTDYLDEIEEGDGEVTLSVILNFFSGADAIPPCGFPMPATISFNSTNPYPTASTCAIELTLPTRFYNDYNKFKESCVTALLYHGGFGLS